MLAEAKLQALNERFREWLWEDPERTDRLVEVYNRRYNATVLCRFDGSHLTFPGLAEWFQPYGSQRDIAYRIAATPAALCGFAVGGGKTAAMFLSALTVRRPTAPATAPWSCIPAAWTGSRPSSPRWWRCSTSS